MLLPARFPSLPPLLLTLLAFSYVSVVDARLPAVAGLRTPYQMYGFWGQNRIGYNIPGYSEPTLVSVCSSTNYSTIHIGYIVSHFSTGGAPGMEFTNHCSFILNNAYPGYTTATSGYSLLYCPDIGKDIKTCQGMGKKIILTISPKVETLVTESDGVKSAQQIYNFFVAPPSSGTPRPFDDAQVDGIDLYILTNENPLAYVSFVRTMRTLMDGGSVNSSSSATGSSSSSSTASATPAASSGTYKPPTAFTISATVGCQFPSAFMGPTYANRTLTLVPELVDYLVVAFRASAGCSWGSTRDGFWNATDAWNKFVAGVGTGNGTNVTTTSRTMEWAMQVPNFGYGYEVYEEAMTGDFINTTSLYAENVVPRLRALSRFSAMSLFESSFDQINKPCTGDNTTRYADVLYTQLQTADVTAVGSGTSPDKRCQFRTDNPLQALGLAPTATTSGSGAQTQGTFGPAVTRTATAVPDATAAAPLTTGAIIGIAAGAGGALGLAAFGAVLYRQHRGKQDEDSEDDDDSDDNSRARDPRSRHNPRDPDSHGAVSATDSTTSLARPQPAQATSYSSLGRQTIPRPDSPASSQGTLNLRAAGAHLGDNSSGSTASTGITRVHAPTAAVPYGIAPGVMQMRQPAGQPGVGPSRSPIPPPPGMYGAAAPGTPAAPTQSRQNVQLQLLMAMERRRG
ncbi:glycoside hydrolase family 18 protein [Gonapodya prolifera JEL478]|uniref:Glycoside hydrolase family 18 protein n=1 Tax=Gonapodya prolifera (strain JEL478) TaxID=1344416 RepID=A0A139AIV7_GONPJ|nr:glycoside hydrolase family 18 protein [Gonapodya prolifera JEL478]|eukprot:KXS16717.1 glycoside hydrolase family 18 protein [Gonapodya prolifera JEL478]